MAKLNDCQIDRKKIGARCFDWDDCKREMGICLEGWENIIRWKTGKSLHIIGRGKGPLYWAPALLAVCLVNYKEMWNRSSDTHRVPERQALLPHFTNEKTEAQCDLPHTASTWQRLGFMAGLSRITLCFSTVSASVMTPYSCFFLLCCLPGGIKLPSKWVRFFDLWIGKKK